MCMCMCVCVRMRVRVHVCIMVSEKNLRDKFFSSSKTKKKKNYILSKDLSHKSDHPKTLFKTLFGYRMARTFRAMAIDHRSLVNTLKPSTLHMLEPQIRTEGFLLKLPSFSLPVSLYSKNNTNNPNETLTKTLEAFVMVS